MMQLIKALKEIEILQGIPDQQIQWLANKGNVKTFKAGDYVFKQDAPLNKMIILLTGAISLKLSQNGQFKEIHQIEPGGISGTLPYSRAKKSAASSIADADSTVFMLDKDHFDEMIKCHHELTTALVQIMTTRVREFTTVQQQDDKMMSLGKLSAGLAHELNNPASAVVRSSSELKKSNDRLPGLIKNVVSLNLPAEDMEAVNHFLIKKGHKQKELNLKERSSLEDELTLWLEQYPIEDSYEIAEVLSDFNFSLEDLDLLLQKVGKANLKPILEWLSQTLVANKLVLEIYEGAKRISDLVLAIKAYSHMDRSADKEQLDVHEGINSTITMLSHKIKGKKIQVNKEFSDTLGTVNACAGTLNQVWTNLIDNAIDAMEEGGTLAIKTFRENGNIKINVVDNGRGIEPSIKDKIFDPFYTTKDVGKGTGLGLDIVRKIIVQHQGSIKVESEPGKTTFQICLPQN